MFSGLRAMLGLDEVVTVNVGAAPTPPEVIEFFHAIGIELAELWGMSETCGAGTVQPRRRGADRHGRAGDAGRRAETRRGRRAADPRRVHDARLPQPARADGRGAGRATAGSRPATSATIDDDGYVRIVDRKKELIINAAGKNMSPANIEATLKAASPLIGQACAIGDAPPVQRRADRARRRLRADVGRARGDRGARPADAGEGPAHARGRAGGRRRRQREAGARRADQALRDRRGRLAARRRRADADDEAQAQADRGEVRARRSRRCTPAERGLVHWGRWPRSGRSTSAPCPSAAARPSPCRR